MFVRERVLCPLYRRETSELVNSFSEGGSYFFKNGDEMVSFKDMKIPEEMREEVNTLSGLGVDDSDIEYLLRAKIKSRLKITYET